MPVRGVRRVPVYDKDGNEFEGWATYQHPLLGDIAKWPSNKIWRDAIDVEKWRDANVLLRSGPPLTFRGIPVVVRA